MGRTEIYQMPNVDAWKQRNIDNSRIALLQQLEREKRANTALQLEALFARQPQTNLKGIDGKVN